MEDTQDEMPNPKRSGSVWPGLFNAVFLLVLIAGLFVWLDAPALKNGGPKEVLASERYGHVSRMATEMEALIGQIEALSTGTPASAVHPQPETKLQEPHQ